MTYPKLTLSMVVLSVSLLICGTATAGPYADDMAKCLVKSTSEADKRDLIKWMFGAFSLHPDVESMVSVTNAEREQLNKNAGKLFMKLLTVSCKKETEEALKYEGKHTISNSFRILGSVAARGLMSHPNVGNFIAGLDKHVDKQKLDELFGQHNQ